MIFHILANAIKFNKEMGGRIYVNVSFQDQKLQMKIVDTGSGMTQEQINSSYEAFGNVKLHNKQGGSHLTTSGIGLGISTSYKLAKAMRGDLVITSVNQDDKDSDNEKETGTTVSMFVECFEADISIKRPDSS